MIISNTVDYNIAKISLNNLEEGDFSQLISDSEQVLSKNTFCQSDAAVQRWQAELDTHMTTYQALLHKKRASALSKELEKADQDRDDAYLTLLHFIRGYARVQTGTIPANYQLLKELVSNYTALERESYAAETADINHLLAKLSEKTYKAALSELNLVSFVEQLKETQATFEKLYAQRAADDTQKPTTTKAKGRKDVVTSYGLIVDYVAVMSFAYPENQECQAAFTALNSIRKRYADNLARSKGKKNANKAANTSDKTTPETPTVE